MANAAAGANASEGESDCQVQSAEWKLKILASTGNVYTLSCDGRVTLGKLKAQLEQEHGIAVERQRMFYHGQELMHNEQTFQSIGVTANQPLQLQIRPDPFPAVTDDVSPPQQLEQRPWWYNILIPSHSGTVATLGQYAGCAAIREEIRDVRLRPPGTNAIDNVTAGDASGASDNTGHVTAGEASEASELPLWYRLLVPSHTGTVVSLGEFAPADALPADIPTGQDSGALPALPWPEVARLMNIGQPDRQYMRGE